MFRSFCTMPPRHQKLLASFSVLASVLLATGAPSSAHAQTANWPTKPIRIIVPYSAGGGTDIIARRLAQGLGPLLKQSVIVENKPGANGIIGTDVVAKSEPDGQTFVLVVSTHLINPLVTKNMPYDTFKDLAGVTVVADSPLIFVTSAPNDVEGRALLMELGMPFRDMKKANEVEAEAVAAN